MTSITGKKTFQKSVGGYAIISIILENVQNIQEAVANSIKARN